MGLRLVQVIIIIIWDRPIRPVRYSMYRIARRLCRLVGQRLLSLPGFEPDSCSMMGMARQASGASQAHTNILSLASHFSHSLGAWRGDKVSFREITEHRQASSRNVHIGGVMYVSVQLPQNSEAREGLRSISQH